MTVTVKYGLESWTGQVDTGSTFSEVLDITRSKLGFGDKVNALISGVAMPGDAEVQGGSTITVETRCNTKAV